MNEIVHSTVLECTRASENNTLSFPQILDRLAETGVEGYLADLRRSVKTYHLSSGETIEVPSAEVHEPIAEAFDASVVESAVRQSQAGTHTYHDFCRKVMAAGCAGYLVSLLGHRVVYFGRTAETHVEHFPSAR